MNSDYYINLHFNQAIPQKTGYAFKIGDKGCTFHLHCVDLNPTGMNPHIVFNHSNGTCVEGVPTGSGQDYVYVIQGNEFGVCGQVVVDMKFYDAIGELATQRISTASFTLDVIPDTLTPFDESASSYADSLEHAREEIDAAILALQGAEEDLNDAEEDLDDMSELFGDTLQDYIDAFGNTAPINPRGVYDATATYHPRDAVSYTYNGRTLTYMNMRQSTGVAPTDTDYWQVIIDVSIGGTFSALDDVDIDDTTLADDQVPMWDDTAGKWKNKALPTEQVNAIVNVYGAKNIIKNELYKYGASVTSHDVTFTQLQDGTISMSGTATAGIAILITLNGFYVPVSGDYKLSGGDSTDLSLIINDHNGATVAIAYGTEVTVSLSAGELYNLWISVANGTVATGRYFYPMLRDARIVDPTYEPYAKTNLQLTNDKAERSDLASLNLTGTKNTTGATITAGTYFYLNGQYCRVTQDILNNADFTENTNYKVTTVHGSLASQNATGTYGSAIHVKRLAGDLVSFVIDLGGSNNIASGTLLGTVPAELRPYERYYFNVLVNVGTFGLIEIYKDGSVTYYGASPALYAYGSGVYSLA